MLELLLFLEGIVSVEFTVSRVPLMAYKKCLFGATKIEGQTSKKLSTTNYADKRIKYNETSFWNAKRRSGTPILLLNELKSILLSKSEQSFKCAVLSSFQTFLARTNLVPFINYKDCI